MGELRQRGAIWRIRYYRNGRRFEESSRSTKWETPNRLLKQREGAVADGLPVSSAIGRLKFEDAAADLLTNLSARGPYAIDVMPWQSVGQWA